MALKLALLKQRARLRQDISLRHSQCFGRQQNKLPCLAPRPRAATAPIIGARGAFLHGTGTKHAKTRHRCRVFCTLPRGTEKGQDTMSCPFLLLSIKWAA